MFLSYLLLNQNLILKLIVYYLPYYLNLFKNVLTVAHPNPPNPPCPDHVANVNAGSPNVYVVGIKVGRIGDSADAGAMTSGSGNVFANG